MLESFQVPAHEVLGEFRARLQQVVRPEDVQTHYDLGIAYKEMGLLDEAVAEFEVALQHGGGTRGADCLTMLGVCELERGNGEAATRHFQQGLELPGLAAAARHALQFELGGALESLGRPADAVEQYQTLAGEDASYRDVAARLQRLGGAVAKGRPIVKPSSTPPAAQRKAAAQTGAAPAARAASGTSQPNDIPQKNRKIGFV